MKRERSFSTRSLLLIFFIRVIPLVEVLCLPATGAQATTRSLALRPGGAPHISVFTCSCRSPSPSYDVHGYLKISLTGLLPESPGISFRRCLFHRSSFCYLPSPPRAPPRLSWLLQCQTGGCGVRPSSPSRPLFASRPFVSYFRGSIRLSSLASAKPYLTGQSPSRRQPRVSLVGQQTGHLCISKDRGFAFVCKRVPGLASCPASSTEGRSLFSAITPVEASGSAAARSWGGPSLARRKKTRFLLQGPRRFPFSKSDISFFAGGATAVASPEGCFPQSLSTELFPRLDRLFSQAHSYAFSTRAARRWPSSSYNRSWREPASPLCSASSSQQGNLFRQPTTDTTGGKEEDGHPAGQHQRSEGHHFQMTGLADELQKSFLCYAYSTILSRALPDARDGLKPVHRRLIYAMHGAGEQQSLERTRSLCLLATLPISFDVQQLRLHASGSFRKCARVVGEVLGKFHPHGDQAVYDALVRLSQTFVVTHPLIEGHGNFGSVDGDPPAAMRYTECRLTRFSEDVLLRQLDEKVVSFKPNFDASEREPLVFPARVPLLLVQGSSGIAVGMSTQIPPHNLHEVIDATIALIRNPQLSDTDLTTIVPGPDFPTGGLLMNGEQMEDTYARGHGRVQLRGKAHVEDEEEEDAAPRGEKGSNMSTPGSVPEKGESGDGHRKGKTKTERRLVITELPYSVNKSTLLQAIGQMIASRFLEGVSSIRDESDWRGVRIVLVLRPEAEAQVVLSTLLRHTNLQIFVPVNLIALDNHGTRPCRFSLKSLLLAWIAFRFETIRRMLGAEREERGQRAHLLEGLLRAVGLMDAVVKTVRESFSASEARQRLTSAPLNFSPPQANALLRLTLSRLTGLERQELQREYEEQLRRLNRLQELLNREEEIYGLMIEELQEIRDSHEAKRRTKIVQTAAQRRKARQRGRILKVMSAGMEPKTDRVERPALRGGKTHCTRNEESRQSTTERNSSHDTEQGTEKLSVFTHRTFSQEGQITARSDDQRGDSSRTHNSRRGAIGREWRKAGGDRSSHEEGMSDQAREPTGTPTSCPGRENEGATPARSSPELTTEELEAADKGGPVSRGQAEITAKEDEIPTKERDTACGSGSGADKGVEDDKEEEEEAVVPFGEAQEIEEEDLIPSHQNVVLFSATSYLRRLPLSQIPTLKRGAVGIRTAPLTPRLSVQPTEDAGSQESSSAGERAAGDPTSPAISRESCGTETYSSGIHGLCVCRSRDRLLLVTHEGLACSLPAYKIPLGSRSSRGLGLAQLLLAARRGKGKTGKSRSRLGKMAGYHSDSEPKSSEAEGKKNTQTDSVQAHLAAVLSIPHSSVVRRDTRSGRRREKIREAARLKLIVVTKRGMIAKISASVLLGKRGASRGLRKVITCAAGDRVVAAGIVEECDYERTGGNTRLRVGARRGEKGGTVAVPEGEGGHKVGPEEAVEEKQRPGDKDGDAEGGSPGSMHCCTGLAGRTETAEPLPSRRGPDLVGDSVDAIRGSESTVLVVTRLGRALHFPEACLRTSRTGKSRGVRAIRLKSGDSVVALAVVPSRENKSRAPEPKLLRATLRESPKEELAANQILIPETRALAQKRVSLAQEQEEKTSDVLVVTTSGVGKRIRVSSLGMRGRGGTGVKILQLKHEEMPLLRPQQGIRLEESAKEMGIERAEQQKPENHPGQQTVPPDKQAVPDSGSPAKASLQGRSSSTKSRHEEVASVVLVPSSRTHNGTEDRQGQGDILLVSREGFILRQASGKIPLLRGRLARGVSVQNLQHQKREDKVVAAGVAR